MKNILIKDGKILYNKEGFPEKPCQDSCTEDSYCFDTCAKEVGYFKSLQSAIDKSVEFEDDKLVLSLCNAQQTGYVAIPTPDGAYELSGRMGSKITMAILVLYLG